MNTYPVIMFKGDATFAAYAYGDTLEEAVQSAEKSAAELGWHVIVVEGE